MAHENIEKLGAIFTSFLGKKTRHSMLFINFFEIMAFDIKESKSGNEIK